MERDFRDFNDIRKPVPGSAAEIAMRQKSEETKRAEKLMDSMKDEFPQLKRMYEMLKK